MLTLDIKTIPRSPGVYLFRNGHEILYVGKANDLKNRVASYFRSRVSEKIRTLRSEATSLETIILTSEIEALIKEAELIKRHIPKFNVLMRDDKNYAYVAITHEPFPHIFVTHQPSAGIYKHKKNKSRHFNRIVNPVQKYDTDTAVTPRQERSVLKGRDTSEFTSIGPYTSSASLKITLKLLRKLFPYCTCSMPHTRTCLNAQLGLCPKYCCTRSVMPHNRESSQKEYHAHIHAIISVLTGKGRRIIHDLKKSIRLHIKTQNFEQAAILRDQAIGIEDVLAHRSHLIRTGIKKKNQRIVWRTMEKNIIMALGIPGTTILRIEGYDISHVSGTSSTGSMVVVTDGMPDHNNYRMFKIKTVTGINDGDMLKEVIYRRLQHREWQFPDLMVIDGGKPQLNAVMTVIRSHAPQLIRRVVALAKREEELYSPHIAHTIRLDSLPPETGFFFQRIRDESHRFAKQY
ncbi:MAG: GIY-YIG nuclease family protein, partial [Patescibacteria group bacterium]